MPVYGPTCAVTSVAFETRQLMSTTPSLTDGFRPSTYSSSSLDRFHQLPAQAMTTLTLTSPATASRADDVIHNMPLSSLSDNRLFGDRTRCGMPHAAALPPLQRVPDVEIHSVPLQMRRQPTSRCLNTIACTRNTVVQQCQSTTSSQLTSSASNNSRPVVACVTSTSSVSG